MPGLPAPQKPSFLQRTVGAGFLKTLQTSISSIKPSDWMSALQPLQPWLPMIFGRQWDFPVGRNLNYIPRSGEKITFQQLRGFANASEIVRLAIETRKDQLCSQPWQIKGKADSNVKENDPRIAKWTKFFQRPDGENKWSDWYRILLEELFVTDAVSIWRAQNRAGKLCYLRLLDGATIFPLIDDQGYRPAAPSPAYQQILKGVPKGNYSTDELLYAVRNKRVYTVYGYSPVEQCILSCKTDIERQKYSLSYFTEGSMPDGYVTMPDGMSVDQIKAFEDRTNTMLAGNAPGRRQMPFWPFGTKVETLKQPNALKDDFDEWIARKICFALSIPPTPFIKAMNRANADAQHSQAIEEGQGPVMDWTSELVTDVMASEGDDDLEHAFLDDKEMDQAAQSTILVTQVGAGIITRNEARDILGMDPVTEDAADALLVTTGSGLVPLPGSDMDQQMQDQKLDQQIQINASKPPPMIAPPNGQQPGAQPNPKKPASPQPNPQAKPAKKSLGKAVRHPAIPFRASSRYSGHHEPHEDDHQDS